MNEWMKGIMGKANESETSLEFGKEQRNYFMHYR